jgi:hypothetical protein
MHISPQIIQMMNSATDEAQKQKLKTMAKSWQEKMTAARGDIESLERQKSNHLKTGAAGGAMNIGGYYGSAGVGGMGSGIVYPSGLGNSTTGASVGDGVGPVGVNSSSGSTPATSPGSEVQGAAPTLGASASTGKASNTSGDPNGNVPNKNAPTSSANTRSEIADAGPDSRSADSSTANAGSLTTDLKLSSGQRNNIVNDSPITSEHAVEQPSIHNGIHEQVVNQRIHEQQIHHDHDQQIRHHPEPNDPHHSPHHSHTIHHTIRWNSKEAWKPQRWTMNIMNIFIMKIIMTTTIANTIAIIITSTTMKFPIMVRT